MSPLFAQARSPHPFLAMLHAIGSRPPVAAHSKKRTAVWFADACQSRQAFVGGLAKIAWSEFGYELKPPPLPTISADIAAGKEGNPIDVLSRRLREYDAQLDSKLNDCRYFGRVKYVGDHECVFTYHDSRPKQHGILQSTLEIAGHEHHLVQTRERKLADWDVQLPPKQRRILRSLPQEVLPNVRVLQGLLILAKEQSIESVSRDHAVGRVLRQVGGAAAKYGPGAVGGVAAGAAAAGAVTAVIAAVKLAAATATVMAVADPAIVIGDLVISGWIEAEVA